MPQEKGVATTCNTVGELKKCLEQWPDEKPILVDVNGDTFPVMVYDWADSEDKNSLDWPVAIQGNFD